MRMNRLLRNKVVLLGGVLLILLVLKLLMEGLNPEKLIASVVIPIPFVYWWVIPYLLDENMEMPSWGFSLEADGDRFLRLVFFLLGFSIYFMCMLI